MARRKAIGGIRLRRSSIQAVFIAWEEDHGRDEVGDGEPFKPACLAQRLAQRSRSLGAAKRLWSLSVATGTFYPARRSAPAPKAAARTKRAGSPNATGRLERLAKPPTSTGPTKDPR